MSEIVGTLTANHSVDPNGSLTIDVPLMLPPAKMAPNLSLSYHSASNTASAIGMGWTIKGASYIERVPATIIQDKMRGAVSYDSNDRFALNGQRLVSIGNNEYRFEIDTWSKIVAYGNDSSNPDYWVEHLPDGTQRTFGNTPDSNIKAAGGRGTRAWAVSQNIDTFENFVTYSYHNDAHAGAFYLSQVQYGGNQTLRMTHQRKILFNYDLRPDIRVRYVGGYKISTEKRLSTITSFVQGSLAHTHTLNYDDAPLSSVSRLVSITLSDASGTPVRPLKFDWVNGDASVFKSARHTKSIKTQGSSASVMALDVHASGKSDLVIASKRFDGTSRLHLDIYRPDAKANISDVSHSQTFSNLPYPTQLLALDFNGNGRTDFLHIAKSTKDHKLTLLLSTPNGYVPQESVPFQPPFIGGSFHVGDFMGTGRIGLLYIYQVMKGSSPQICFIQFISDGKKFNPLPAREGPLGVSFKSIHVITGDLNGDHAEDVFILHSAYKNGSNRVQIDLLQCDNNGHLQYRSDKPLISVAESIVWTSNINFLPYSADEDGKTSLLAVSGIGGHLQLQMIRSSGTTLLPPSPLIKTSIPYNGNVSLTKTSSTTAVDLVNTFTKRFGSDAHTEITILRFHNDSFTVLDSVRQPSTAASFVTWADLRGLGRVDCLLNTLDHTGQLTVHTMECANTIPPDHICGYENGLGAKLQVAYAPLSDRSTYTADGADESTSPVATINALARNMSFSANLSTSTVSQSSTHTRSQIVYFPSYVVKQLKHTPYAARPDVVDQSDYTYKNARYGYDGRGWLGFETVTKTAVVIGQSTATDYHQEYPLIGQQRELKVTDLRSGDSLKVTRNVWTSSAGHNDHIHVVSLSQVKEKNYESGAFAYEVNADYGYDDYGNITDITLHTPQTGTLPLSLTATFLNDPQAWILGRKISETVKQNSSALKQTKWSYDSKSPTPTQESKRISDGGSWSTQMYEFDPTGNAVTVKGPGLALRKQTYDPTYTNVTSSSVYTSAGSQPLTETAISDLVTGQLTTSVSPTGDTTTIVYDILGRMVQASVGNREDGMKVVEKQAYETDGTHFYQIGYTESGKDGEDVWFKSVSHLDGNQRVWRTEVPRPDDPNTSIYSDIEYDGAGRIVKRARDYLENTLPSYATFSYDALSRPTRQIVPPVASDVSSVTTTYEYSFSQGTLHAKEIQSDGNTTVTTCRDLQHLPNPEPTAANLTKAFVVSSLNELNQVVKTSYDGLGQPVSVSDPSGTCLKLSWDGLGRVIKRTVTNSEEGSTSDIHKASASFDDDKGTVTITNELTGSTVVTQMDWAGRAVSKVTAEETLNMTYDAGGQFTQEHLASVSSSLGIKHTFDYDRRGNVSSATVTVDSVPYTSSYKWSLSGELLHITNPDGTSVKRNLYGDGETIQRAELFDATNTLRAWVNFHEYNDVYNRPLSCDFGNGISSASTIAPNGSLADISLTKNGAVIHHQSWKIDAFSRIQHYSAKHSVSTSNVTSRVFSYDGAGQLTKCTPDTASADGAAEEFLYDSSGNLKTKNGKTFVNKGWQLHEIKDSSTGSTEYTFKYSTDGSVIAKVNDDGQDATSMEYDSEGRLIKLNDTKFVYDFGGRLLKAILPNGNVRVYPSQSYEVEISASNETTHTAYLPQGYRRASLTTTVSTSTVHYFHADHLGSTVAVSDSDGNIVSEYQYDSFGKIKDSAGDDLARYKFSGKEVFDGLYYFGARFYDPDTGRFLTLDNYPVDVQDATPSTFNMYSFSRNDPINYIDMNGNVPWWHWFVDGLLIVAGAALSLVPGANFFAGALLGAGISGITTDFEALATGKSDDLKWGLSLGIGAAVGAISGGISLALKALVPAVTIVDVSANMGAITGRMVAGWALRTAVRIAVRTASGSALGVLKRMAENGIEGKRWDDGLGNAAISGAVSGLQSGGKSNAKKFLKPLKGKGLKFWKNRNWKVYRVADQKSVWGLSQASKKSLDYPLRNGGPALTGYRPIGEFSSQSRSYMQQSRRFLPSEVSGL